MLIIEIVSTDSMSISGDGPDAPKVDIVGCLSGSIFAMVFDNFVFVFFRFGFLRNFIFKQKMALKMYSKIKNPDPNNNIKKQILNKVIK